MEEEAILPNETFYPLLCLSVPDFGHLSGESGLKYPTY